MLAMLTQCIYSMMAGNRLIIPQGVVGASAVHDFLLEAGIDRQRLELSNKELLVLCSEAELDLVIVDDEDIIELRKVLAARPGARIPVLCSKDAAQLHYIERVVSEDTTASGGNAKLLAGV